MLNNNNDFDFAYLEHLKSTNSAVRLLSAGNSPLILGFIHLVFIQGNRDFLTDTDITSKLSDYLYTIRSTYGDDKYPQTPKKYLDDWATDGYLRKYFSGLDDQLYEPTPAVSKVFEWIQSLIQRQFVGTESRLLTIFSLLQNIVTQTMQDPVEQVNELEKQKAEIQAQIDRIKRGEQDTYDPTRIKEQFYQVEDTVRQLIGDFRQIEKNFRDLNSGTKQIIATSGLSKGKMLDMIFGDQDLIWDTDQGKSFAAFWELMLSPEKQSELENRIKYIYALDEIKELDPKPLVLKTRYMLLDAGGRVYKSNSKLTEQLRRYLESKTYLENRRILELMKPIEQAALELRDAEVSRRTFLMEIPEIGVDFPLAMTQRLFVIPSVPVINSEGITIGTGSEADMDMLFSQQFIDKEKLRDNIQSALQKQPQISLCQLLDSYPLEYGVAELVTYFDLAHTGGRHVVDESVNDEIIVKRQDGRMQLVKMFRVIFVR